MKPSELKQYPGHVETLDEHLDPNSSLTIMAELAGERKRVLDLGCATGYFARLLTQRHCEVVGVDINAEAVEASRAHGIEAIVADLDAAPLSSIVKGRRFDVVVCGDVLEHLLNPARLLEEIRDVIEDDGYLVASFPNVAHGAIRLSLLQGRFDYQDEGLLDDTHVRFFTLKTIDEMLIGAGYRVEELRRSTMDVFEASSVLPMVDRTAFDEQVVERVLNEPEADTLQFIVKAFPLSDAARHRALLKRYSAANTELANVQLLLEARNREVAALRERAAAAAKELDELKRAYETRIAEMETAFAAQLDAEAAKTRAQADQIAAYIAFGNGKTS